MKTTDEIQTLLTQQADMTLKINMKQIALDQRQGELYCRRVDAYHETHWKALRELARDDEIIMRKKELATFEHERSLITAKVRAAIWSLKLLEQDFEDVTDDQPTV